MKVLVAGIGNIFMGDDGFGCEVAEQLGRRVFPSSVDVVDFGIRGLDLSYALMDGYEAVILIDTVDRGDAPGTVFVMEPQIDDVPPVKQEDALMSPHGMDPASVLRSIAIRGQQRPRVLMVGCQPQFLGGEHGHMGLSEVVSDSVATAVAAVVDLLRELLANEQVSV